MESLEIFVFKWNKKETSILLKQNLEEKEEKKQRKQIRLDSKFLFILPRSTRSPQNNEKSKPRSSHWKKKISNAISPPFKLKAIPRQLGISRQIPPPPADKLRVMWQIIKIVYLLLHRHFISFDNAKQKLKQTRKSPPKR